MCGPLVTRYANRFSGGSTQERQQLTFSEIRHHLLFNGGRTLSYALLGGLFGVAGAITYDAAAIVFTISAVVRASTGLLIGILILITGFRYLFDRQTHGVVRTVPLLGRLTSLFEILQSRVTSRVSGSNAVLLGLLHGLLPCPLIYPAYLYAFARGDPLGGVVTLGVLGLGTIPTLFIYGTVMTAIDTTTRNHLHRALGAAFLILGLMPIAHSLSLFGIPVPHIEPPIYQPLSG
jgi:sulfite exporter TauE/SafE